MFLLELDPTQLVLLADILEATDREGRIPAGKGLALASLRQQTAQPALAAEVVARFKAQGVQEAQAAASVHETSESH
jgi:hypothetical protein